MQVVIYDSNMCMYAYAYMYAYVCMYVCTHACVYIHIMTGLFIHRPMSLYIYIYIYPPQGYKCVHPPD